MKNQLGLTVGFKNTTVFTGDAMNMFGTSTSQPVNPQHDTWRGVYFGLRYSR